MNRKRSDSPDYGRARILLMTGHHREAMREFRRVLRRNPKDLDALFQLARARLQMGNAVRARKLFGRCASLDRRGKWTREIVGHLKTLG